MGVCAGKIHHDHEGCEHTGNEAKLNLQLFYNEKYDNYSGHCFSCGHTVKAHELEGTKRPKVKVKTKEELLQEVQEIKKLPVVPAKFRGIPASFYSAWGVRQGVSEYDGKTPFAVYYGYTEGALLLGWKVRQLAYKNFWSVGSTKGADPFGWIMARKRGGVKLYITEGEQDAIALDYILQLYDAKSPKFKKRRHAIVSLPNGADSMARTLKMARKHWKEIVLVVDNDGAGKLSITKAQKLMPEVKLVDMPLNCKDANDAVVAGPKSMDLLAQNCIFNAHKPPIKGVITVADVRAKASIKPTMGLSYPMEELNEASFGQRFSECVAVGSGVGLGKTLLAHEWISHNTIFHKEPCFGVLLEESNHASLRNIAGKIDSIPYHNPKVDYDQDQLADTFDRLNDKLFLWESEGDQYLRFDLDEIIKAIRFNVLEFGTRFVYIDNMTRLVDHLTTSLANEFINKYASELENLSSQLDINITVFSHLNAGNIAHEWGGTVKENQFTGSKGMMRSFPMMLGFERNKHAEDGNASKSYLNILKNRKFGNEKLIKTQYSPRTGRLQEYNWEGKGFLESSGGYIHERK